MNIKPNVCPRCNNDNLNIGDCGYSSFNVCWVECKDCGLCVKDTGDDAIPKWNKWSNNPAEEIKKIFYREGNKVRKNQNKDCTLIEEWAIEEIIKKLNAF